MSLIATEVGKSIYLAAGFDMSANTSMTITLTDSAGVLDDVIVTDDRITVESGTYADPELGTLASNEWCSFTTLSTDFPSAGTYTAYITYAASGKNYFSRSATITVLAVGS